MYRLVLPLSFSILLVHAQKFFMEEAAEDFRSANYPKFPCLEIWKQGEVDTFNGTIIPFPLGVETHV